MKNRVMKIVVMGGSFNPPTIAHYRLMKAAIDALDADMGFFVPVSDAYLKRKMGHCHPPVALSEELRVRMLKSMCTDDRMAVCEKEIGTIEPRTMPTLLELQKDYPEAELYFVMGADKLKLLVSLTERRGFLNEFRVVLFSREGTAIEEIIKRDSVLSPYIQRIVTLPQPEGTDNISSSMVRTKMLSGEPTREYLCDGVWKLFRSFELADFPDMIKKFTGEYAYLSNRFGCKMIWKGVRYSCAEAAALKEKEQMSPSEWEAGCNEIMEAIIRTKFEQNPELMAKLSETGNIVLINGNSKQETYWGVDLYSWQGENILGKILMNLRNKQKFNEIHNQ